MVRKSWFSPQKYGYASNKKRNSIVSMFAHFNTVKWKRNYFDKQQQRRDLPRFVA